MRVINESNQVIGLVVESPEGGYSQTNIYVGESIEVEEVTEQLIQLCDPYKKLLKLIEEV